MPGRCGLAALFGQSAGPLRLATHSRRWLTSSAGQSSPSEQTPKPYRKAAATPLRRTASASLPIRSNPTPTRSDIQPIFTLATAERYLFSRLRGRLPAASQLLHESYWVPKWGSGGKEGEVFVFENGSFVCWGLGEEDARKFASEVITRGTEIGHLREAETEELDFVMDPTEQTRLQGDLIILGDSPPLSSAQSLPENLPPSALPAETLLARYAFSQALSRSTALSALEVALDDYLSSVAALPHSLETTGKPGLGRTALIKKLGRLMKFRQGLNLNRSNFSDTPDFYWAEPVLEGYFKRLSDALEVKTRTSSVNDKITYAAEVQSVLRQLLTESTAHRMELVIIALIAVEVVVALIRDGPELWHMIVS
ncbi:hypothetical protein GLOTRDRAFT_130494 [Gloeophyllum trabeum ATCC 11539]|uniref:DUF155 domain-containing protein n=1 Tax=Gloeophyllum trabeum (strain ATCC 11539 / FP-39264 / Madison 617) TaxID=670483 RepID=S7Q4E1_GLOTA|nr:uncharacterized protein GLOTRDRAFT_130494 [Gloeophyllum trabeum ATCC 11539]EPQ54377.1 hypothetical protein GLOTRDRAFT_130494 [Gloeophyllum trabeum ATCC 11539]